MCSEERKVLIHGRYDRPRAKEKPKSKLKRYSMPVAYVNKNVNGNKHTRSLSLDGIPGKHGKYRPWSVDINEKFREWLQENAFESDVQLVGYCDLVVKKTENEKNTQDRKLVDRNMNDTSEKSENHRYQGENEQEIRTKSKENCELPARNEENSCSVKEVEALSKTSKHQGICATCFT